MAVICTSTTVIPNSACYTQQTLTPKQQKALLIVAKAFLLSGQGGTDYTGVLASTLVTDAVQMVCGITPDQLTAVNLAIWMEAGGLTSGSTLNSKLSSAKCITALDDQTLEKMNVFLTCKVLAQLGL